MPRQVNWIARTIIYDKLYSTSPSRIKLSGEISSNHQFCLNGVNGTAHEVVEPKIEIILSGLREKQSAVVFNWCIEITQVDYGVDRKGPAARRCWYSRAVMHENTFFDGKHALHSPLRLHFQLGCQLE